MSKSNERMDNPKKKTKNFTFHKHQIFVLFYFFLCKHLIHPSIHVNTVLYENYYSTFRKTTQRKLSFYFFILTFVNFQFFFSVHKTTLFDSCISSQHYMDKSFILVIFIISVFVCCPLPMFFFLFGHIIVISLFFH